MTTYLGKSCSFGLPRVPFVNCGQFMYLVISLLVLRAGYGICLYQFLIIAYLFTYVGAIIESDARLTGVQLKREAKLLTVIGLNTKHADCRIIFMLYPICL